MPMSSLSRCTPQKHGLTHKVVREIPSKLYQTDPRHQMELVYSWPGRLHTVLLFSRDLKNRKACHSESNTLGWPHREDGELEIAQYKPRKRFKDVIKDNLKTLKVDVNNWETLAENQPKWRKLIRQGCAVFEQPQVEHGTVLSNSNVLFESRMTQSAWLPELHATSVDECCYQVRDL